VAVTVTVNVARSPEEAERQARGENVIAAQMEEDRALGEAQAQELAAASIANEAPIPE
jgi:large subunit ribosomal protein L9